MKGDQMKTLKLAKIGVKIGKNIINELYTEKIDLCNYKDELSKKLSKYDLINDDYDMCYAIALHYIINNL